MKRLFRVTLISAVSFLSISAFSAELTPTSLIGKYTLEAHVFFQKIYGNFNVLNTLEFEFQRTYPDGKVDEICVGTYTLKSAFILAFDERGILATGKQFKGLATCPSDRTKNIEFNVDFLENTRTEDLERGTNVKVRASATGGKGVTAFFKKAR